MSQKRAYIIHGWAGSPQDAWIPWLKRELEAKGFEVQAPQMPDSGNPRIDLWVGFLDGMIIDPDDKTFFIGHSIGCQTILRYLQILDPGVVVGGAVFVAGWFNLKNYETPDEEKIAAPWITQPLHDDKIREHVKSMSAILSDNDPFGYTNENAGRFRGLGAEVAIEKGAGHLEEHELPQIIQALEKMGVS